MNKENGICPEIKTSIKIVIVSVVYFILIGLWAKFGLGFGDVLGYAFIILFFSTPAVTFFVSCWAGRKRAFLFWLVPVFLLVLSFLFGKLLRFISVEFVVLSAIIPSIIGLLIGFVLSRKSVLQKEKTATSK